MLHAQLVPLVIGAVMGMLPGMPAAGMEGGAKSRAVETDGHRVLVFDGVAKSDLDKCSYRHLTLENGLQALLVSEPGLDKVSPTPTRRSTNLHVGERSIGCARGELLRPKGHSRTGTLFGTPCLHHPL